MVRKIKRVTLDLLRGGGVFELVANGKWRQNRLLILCYHGTSLEDEHLWRPALYMSPEVLGQRLDALRAMRCAVLPLDEALTRLRSRDLPPRSVAITVDDGTYDFYKQAYPLLKKYDFPVTVYQTTLLHRSRDAGFQPDLLLHAVEKTRGSSCLRRMTLNSPSPWTCARNSGAIG